MVMISNAGAGDGDEDKDDQSCRFQLKRWKKLHVPSKVKIQAFSPTFPLADQSD